VIKIKKGLGVNQLIVILKKHFRAERIHVDTIHISLSKARDSEEVKVGPGRICTLVLDIEMPEPKDEYETYLDIYDKYKEAEADLEAAKEVKNAAKTKLINHMTSIGTDSIGRGERSISHTKRDRAIIKDYDALMEWVRNQDEPMSEYTTIAFKISVFGDTIKEAKAKALGSNIKLPPGLGCLTTDVLTVRKRKKQEYKETVSKVELLDEV